MGRAYIIDVATIAVQQISLIGNDGYDRSKSMPLLGNLCLSNSKIEDKISFYNVQYIVNKNNYFSSKIVMIIKKNPKIPSQ